MAKAAIAGLGSIAPLHLEALKQLGITVAATCDPNTAKNADYTGYEEMIDAGGFDVLHICLPHYLHAPAAIYAMDRGINVLCEKPMAISIAEAENMIRTAEHNNVSLGVIFQNRYNPGAMMIKKALTSGAGSEGSTLGKVKAGALKVNWFRSEEYYTESDWRGKWATEGGGVLINQSIHTFDLANYFLGGKPDYVEASITNRGHPSIEVEDVAWGIISYGDVKISFHVNTIHPFDAPVSLELICENGRAQIEGDDAIIEYNDGSFEKPPEPAAGDMFSLPPGAKSYWGISHTRQIKAFYESLEQNVKPEIDGEEALKTQRLICGIYESAKTGVRVVLA